MDGLLAIHKPTGMSSAQVIRNLQNLFNPSKTFAPMLATASLKRAKDPNLKNKRSKFRRQQVKIGHGGTLDPMATGVLILGIGNGTKHLSQFIMCKKTYEATILFGASTDTYDSLGTIVKLEPYHHVTRSKVAEKLEQFRGEFLQKPPIYSARWMDGKRLYEYAREGKAPPREIDARLVQVDSIEIVEWTDSTAEADSEPDQNMPEDLIAASNLSNTSQKRLNTSTCIDSERRKRFKSSPMSTGEQSPSCISEIHDLAESETIGTSVQNVVHTLPPGPVLKLRMTVSSGFYVRSLAHDLGISVGSSACMSALVRTKQGDFELGHNVVPYSIVEEEEETWGPKVENAIIHSSCTNSS